MNWADWVILGILLVSSLISVKRGFVKEALSLATWLVAFIVAMLFSARLALLLVNLIETPSIREMVAFALLFASTLIVGAMVNHLVSEVVRMTGLAGTDRFFGMIFGLARGLVVVMALLILLPSLLPLHQDQWWHQSALIPHFLAFENWARALAAETTQFFLQWFD